MDDDDEIIEAFYEDDDTEIADNIKKPGATFRSVFGRKIFQDTQSQIGNLPHFSQRQKDAILPSIFMRFLEHRASSDEARPFLKDGQLEDIRDQKLGAELFKAAFEGCQGKRLTFFPFLEEETHLTGHQSLQEQRKAPPYIRSQARELQESGVCGYVDKIHGYMSEFRDAEKTRAAAHEGRVSVKVKGRDRGMVR